MAVVAHRFDECVEVTDQPRADQRRDLGLDHVEWANDLLEHRDLHFDWLATDQLELLLGRFDLVKCAVADLPDQLLLDAEVGKIAEGLETQPTEFNGEKTGLEPCDLLERQAEVGEARAQALPRRSR